MKGVSKMNSFYVEIIVVLLFFSLSAAIIIQQFVVAHNKSQLSEDTSAATVYAQNWLEQLQTCDTSEDLSERLPSEAVWDGKNKAVLFYDGDWNLISSQQDAVYTARISMEVQERESGTMLLIFVQMEKNTQQEPFLLCSLESKRYLPESGITVGQEVSHVN